ncbi:MAG: hypothetical protein VKS61_00920 [Candidatus Sericytochromatia bacterium]|nr:hypothetical protein [Candidatus Sericytochromatia bacterium]
MDARIPTALTAPLAALTARQTPALQAPEAVTDQAAPAPGQAPEAAGAEPAAPAAVNLEEIDLDTTELRALGNMMQTFLADGDLSAAEAKVYDEIRSLFGGKSAPGTQPEAAGAEAADPVGGAGSEAQAGSPEAGAASPDAGNTSPEDEAKKAEEEQRSKDEAAQQAAAASQANAMQQMMLMSMMMGDPVMLDLNHDGQLGTTGNSTAKDRKDNVLGKTVAFDLNGDGVKEQTEWMDGKGDGMLVDDRDGGVTRAAAGNGEIDGTRLFGDEGGKQAHGFEKLARHDANADGKLTGAELEGLKTWIDDGDAKVEAGELKTLAEQGITELSTGMKLERNARGEDLMRSSFVQHGQRHVSEDVWFREMA